MAQTRRGESAIRTTYGARIHAEDRRVCATSGGGAQIRKRVNLRDEKKFTASVWQEEPWFFAQISVGVPVVFAFRHPAFTGLRLTTTAALVYALLSSSLAVAQLAGSAAGDVRRQIEGLHARAQVAVKMRDGTTWRGVLLGAGPKGITLKAEGQQKLLRIVYEDIQSVQQLAPSQAAPGKPGPTSRTSPRPPARTPPREMEGWLVLLFVGGGATVVALAIWLVLREAKRRQEELRDFALQAGFTFQPDEVEDLESLFTEEEYDELRELRRQSIPNDMIRGRTAAGEVLVFSQLCGSGRFRYWQTMAAFPRDGRNLPHFELNPAGWFDKVEQALGMEHSIHFDSHPQFSQQWELRARDQAAVRALFSADTLSYLDTLGTQQRWRVEAARRWLLVWRDHKRIEVADLREFLDQAAAIAAKFEARA